MAEIPLKITEITASPSEALPPTFEEGAEYPLAQMGVGSRTSLELAKQARTETVALGLKGQELVDYVTRRSIVHVVFEE